MERHYAFAGLEFSVSLPQERYPVEENRLAPFEVETVTQPHVFRFELADTLDAPRGTCVVQREDYRIYEDGGERIRYTGDIHRSVDKAYLRAVHRGREHDVQLKREVFPNGIGAKTVLAALETERLVARAGGIVLHSSLIDHGGRGIVFTAPSGTGKSTQAELWRTLRGAEIINGDRAALRMTGGTALADGIPFSGSSPHCLQRSLPLEAIVYLSQAPQSSIERLRGYRAFSRIWEGCSMHTWDKTDVALVSETVRMLAATVPVYHLACTPDESAVAALEQALKEHQKS